VKKIFVDVKKVFVAILVLISNLIANIVLKICLGILLFPNNNNIVALNFFFL